VFNSPTLALLLSPATQFELLLNRPIKKLNMKYNYRRFTPGRGTIRLRCFDYAQEGIYFLTMNCQDRIYRFGNIVEGIMILNKFGEIAHQEWLNTPLIRSNIVLGEFVIMPDHMHGIIKIIENRENKEIPHSPTAFKSPKQTIGAVVRGYKAAVVRRLRLLGFEGKLWQRNYYDRIVWNKEQLRRVSLYIRNNPANWKKARRKWQKKQ
jgi:REP element-mobilizing transposase RayT